MLLFKPEAQIASSAPTRRHNAEPRDLALSLSANKTLNHKSAPFFHFRFFPNSRPAKCAKSGNGMPRLTALIALTPIAQISLAFALAALPLAAECRLPEPAPDALAALSPAQLVEAGHYRHAAELLDPVVKDHPEDAQSAWLLSRAKTALGELDTAMTLAEAALATDDANPAYHIQIALVAGKMAQGAGLLKQLTLVRRARKELDAALAIDPDNPPAQYGIMMYYYAAPALIGGDKTRARQIGENVAATKPDMGYYYLGRLSIEMKDFAAAETYFQKSLAENPQRFDTIAALARLYEEMQPDQPHAEETACQAVLTDPTRGEAWALLARAYAMCGCWDQAADAIARAEQADPANLMAYYSTAAGAIERGENLDVAAGYLAKYLAQPPEGDAPTEAYAHWQLGLALEKQGDHKQAAAELQAALDRDPTLEAAKTELKRLNAEARR
jgi:tetratricopeptide (TPR) repeat protein